MKLTARIRKKILDEPEQPNDFHLGADLLVHLSFQRLLGRLSEFRAAAGESPEILALAIRIIGVVSLLYLVGGSIVLFSAGVPVVLVTKTILWALLSLWFVRGAPQLVRFAYPESH